MDAEQTKQRQDSSPEGIDRYVAGAGRRRNDSGPGETYIHVRFGEWGEEADGQEEVGDGAPSVQEDRGRSKTAAAMIRAKVETTETSLPGDNERNRALPASNCESCPVLHQTANMQSFRPRCL